MAIATCSLLWRSRLLRFGCESSCLHYLLFTFCLQDASNQWGWATAAVIPELENELSLINTGSYQKVLHRLMLLEDLLIENEVCF